MSATRELTTWEDMTKLGVVLGGGGARGLAHIGVLQALAERGIQPDVVVGVSMGAFIGATYAARDDWVHALDSVDRSTLPGHADLATPEGFEFLRAVLSSAVRMVPKVVSFGRNGGFEEFGRQIMKQVLDGEKTFADLRIPYAAIATDVINGTRAVLTEGDVATAVIASAALPIVTRAIDTPEGRYLDGGFADPAPIDVARDLGADVVAMIYVGTPMGGTSDTDGVVMGVLRGFEIGLQRFVEVRLHDADIVIAPTFAEGVSWMSFDRAEELAACGYKAMHERMDDLLALL
jgi:NTE family protein